MRRPFLLALLVLCALPSSASAVTLINPDGSIAQPFQAWANHAKVPTPNGIVTVNFGRCDDAFACYTGASGSTSAAITVRGPQCGMKIRRTCRFTFLHELGHAFDFGQMDEARRAALLTVFRRPGTDWWGSDTTGLDSPPFEKFADAYAMCAIRKRIYSLEFSDGSQPTYWQPGPKQYRAACRIIEA